MAAGRPDGEGGRHGIVKYDLEMGTVITHPFGDGLYTDEPTFIPAGDSEDGGWLLSYVYDVASKKSELHVIDAQDLESPAIAKVKLPQRVPFGFHGIWSAG
jgi:carotenoid cleavage dioxygenase